MKNTHDMSGYFIMGSNPSKQQLDANLAREKKCVEELLSIENPTAENLYELGGHYLIGVGVEKDLDRAIGYYLRAAQLGHQEASKDADELLLLKIRHKLY